MRYNNVKFENGLDGHLQMWDDMGFILSDRGNYYDLRCEFGIGYTVNRHIPFLFDKEDFDKIKKYRWQDDYTKHLGQNGDRPQYHCILTTDVKPKIRLHEVVTGKKFQDHKNHNTFDCRKCNLRDATPLQNAWNEPPSRHWESGIEGVYQKYPGENLWVGEFHGKILIETRSEYEAKKVVLEARALERGEYDYYNPILKDFGIDLEELLSRPRLKKVSIF
jgi:hypothetical protein